MNVLELCTSPGIGGLELYMVRSCAHLTAFGDKVIAVIGKRSRMRQRLEQQCTEAHELNVGFAPLPVFAAKRLSRLIDEQAIDVVHVHWGKDFPVAVLAKMLSRSKPRLVYTRQMQLTRPKKDPYHRFLYSQLDAMLTITEALADSAREYLGEDLFDRVHTLYYGVKGLELPLAAENRRELRRAWGVPDDSLLIGLFARMEAFKGQHLLIEAARKGKQSGHPVHALIVGHAMNEEYPARLRTQVEKHALHSRIHFEDFTDDVQDWMQACDLVVLTTIEETFGLVLVEAMRAGVAVIGSDRGGVPEIIRHGDTGLLFRSGDADDLYRQIERLVTQPDLRAALAAAGKADADRRFDERAHFRALRDYLKPPVNRP